MQDSYENKNPTLFSQACDVASGVFEPDIHRDKALSVTEPCGSLIRRNIVTCKDPELGLFLDDVGGLKFDLRLPGVRRKLPAFIPILDSQTSTLPRSAIPTNIELLGLTIGDVVRKGVNFKAGMWHEQDNIELRSDLLLKGALVGKDVMLFNSGTDTLIEWLWYNREDISLYENLSAMGFSFSTGMNFSVIRGECALGQGMNQKKSLLSAYLSSGMGLPSVPHIYVIDNFEIIRWIEYLKDNPQIQIVSMNCQLQKGQADISAVIYGIIEILEAIPYLHFILPGFRVTEIHRFGALVDRIHLANKLAFKCAQSHQKIIVDHVTLKLRKVYAPSEGIAEILANNINQQRIQIEAIKRTILNTNQASVKIINSVVHQN